MGALWLAIGGGCADDGVAAGATSSSGQPDDTGTLGASAEAGTTLPGSSSVGSSSDTGSTTTLATTTTGSDEGPGSSGTTAVDTDDGSSSSSSDGEVAGSESTGVPAMPDPSLPQFVDVTDDAGVWYIQGEVHTAPNCLIDQIGPGEFGFCNPERIVAGSAIGDYDGDGDADLFVTRTEGTNLLFRNDGGNTFTDATAISGITEYGHGGGAIFGDVDNDGDLDLYVATIASFGHLLYINDGTGHFVEDGLARNASIDSGTLHVGMTPTFGDYDLDGWLDIYVGEWRLVSALGEGQSNSRLLRNRGEEAPGTFEDVTLTSGIDVDGVWAIVDGSVEGTYTFAPSFVDLDDDRYPELTIASDFGTSRVYWNDGDGTFTDRTVEVGAGLDGNGMGSTHGDHDNDGDLDWYVTSISNENTPVDNRLYDNTGLQSFLEIAEPMGVGDNGWGWGAMFFDMDNDADLDLIAVGGYYFTAHVADPIKLWRNGLDGPMLDVSDDVGFNPPRQRRGVSAWDYDEDGDVDVLVTSNADAPELYRNDGGNDLDWLRVKVVGTTSNRDGIGARVYVRIVDDGPEQMREIGTATHFMAQSERAAHFGLGAGDDPVASVRVYWPVSDTTQVFEDVARNQTLVVDEP